MTKVTMTDRLYVADVQSIWSVRLSSGWTRQHVDNVYPMSLSVTDARLLVTSRSGYRLRLFAANGKQLQQVGNIGNEFIAYCMSESK